MNASKQKPGKRHRGRTGAYASRVSADDYRSMISRRLLHETWATIYFAELDFKYNTRKVTDGERTVDAIRLIGGKRLMLKTPKAQGK